MKTKINIPLVKKCLFYAILKLFNTTRILRLLANVRKVVIITKL